MGFNRFPDKRPKIWATAGISIALLGTAACSGGQVVTLYRNSLVLTDARIHVATFDATDKGGSGTSSDYNAGNCQTAAELFMNQHGVNPKIRYWCEHGAFKP